MAPVIHILCGPTASGKSARALEIAQSSGAVIINADAMQVYRELRVLTARPGPGEEARAPHLLYGVLPVTEKCSAARWLALAEPAIRQTFGAGKAPLVTGGTGLYLKALMEGLSAIPEVSPEAHAEAARLWGAENANALAARDPAMAASVKPGDSQRHIRALGVWLETGKSLGAWQDAPRVKLFPDAEFRVEKMEIAREELYRRCDARFLQMLEDGAVQEAGTIRQMQLRPDLPAMRAVGLRELLQHLEGKLSLEEATAKAQQATRNYAKRQLTWFRHQL